MRRLMVSLSASLLGLILVCFVHPVVAHAQSTFTVPVTVGTSTYTLTVRIIGDAIELTSSPGLKVGAIQKSLAAGPALAPALAGSIEVADVNAKMASAIAVPYDELFRHNEDHVGQSVRFVGQVAEYQETTCFLCTEPSYMIRINVTPKGYGFWDDALWVDYLGSDRFLNNDVVTVWGTVTGLKSYTAVLGNTITIPQVEAFAVKLGDVASPTVAGTAATTGPVSKNSANLRGGPGTTYPIVGSVAKGQSLNPIEQSGDGSWLKLDAGAWIATFLVTNPPSDLPVSAESAAPAEAAPVAAQPTVPAAAAPAASPSKSNYAVGEQIVGGGWTFKVTEIHKRKAIYLYDEKDVAMGYYLVVLGEATNNQSGSDYFDKNLDPWLTDVLGTVWGQDGATGYATWQFGGLGTIYSTVDPGEFIKMVMVFDLPPDTGNVMLSLKLPAWVNLGNFSSMAVEDQ